MSGLNKTLKKRENEVKSRVNTPHTNVNSNKFFKPLIASSLALALGVSVGYGYNSNNGGGTITASGLSTTSSTFQDTTVDSAGNSSLPAISWTIGDFGVITNNGNPTITANNAVIIVKNQDNSHLDSDNVGFKIKGNSATGTYTFTNSTLIGSIISQQNDSNGTAHKITFDGNGAYQKSVKLTHDGTAQNITFALVGNAIAEANASAPKFIFSNGANMYGDIYAKYADGTGVVNVEFSNGSQPDTGNIFIGTIKTGRDGNNGTQYTGETKVVFKDKATVISKEQSRTGILMIAQQDDNWVPINNSVNRNNLTLEQGGTITGSIKAVAGTNTITTSGSNNFTLDGNIYANVNLYSQTLSYNANNNLIIGSTAINTLKGNLETEGWAGGVKGLNTVTFNNGTENTIIGNITAKSNASNEITFNSSASTTNQIQGIIKAQLGNNTIKFQQGSGNSLTNLTAILGSNNVTVVTNGLSIKGYVGADGENNQGGSNIIEITSGNLDITQGVYTRGYANAEKGNQITLTDGNLTIGAFASNLTGSDSDSTGNSLHVYNGKNSNVINLDKNDAILSLAGNIFSGSSGTNTINFNGTGGVLKSSSGDSISASGTTNINVQALTIKNESNNTGTLTTTGGTTTLTLKEASGGITGNISTTSGTSKLVFFKDNGNYEVNGNFSTSGTGKNIIDLSSKSATITTDLLFSGSDITGESGNIINIGASKTLTLNDGGQPSAIKSIITSGGTTYINLNGTDANLTGNVETTSGNTKINFKDSASITGTLSVSGTGSTNIAVADAKTGTISDAVSASGTSLVADIRDNSTLALTNGITTSAGTTTINFNGATGTLSGNVSTSAGANTIFNLGSSASTSQTSGSVVATISGAITNTDGNITGNTHAGENFFSINAKTVTLKYGNNSSALAFTAGQNVISFENTSDGGATLNWRSNDDSNKAISTTGGNTIIDFQNSGTIAGGVSTNGSNAITDINIFDNAKGTIEGAITLENSGINNVSFEGKNGVLILKDNATLTNVSNANSANQASNNGISFYHDGKTKDNFKTLTIGTQNGGKKDGIKGSGLNFVVYAISNKPQEVTPGVDSAQGVGTRVAQNGGSSSGVYADKIVIHSSSNAGTSTHHLGVVFEKGTQFSDIVYEKGGTNNILVATVADSSGVSFNQSEKTVLGFTTADVEYATESTDENGSTGSGYKSYYIGKVSNEEIIAAEQEITATAFTLNYDLYMANLNSLNKRMGELRENAHSHGVWARVFNGAQTNNQGLGSKSNYTTIQAGYDYAFGFEGANNYLGFALSYALSTSTSDKAFDAQGEQREIGNIYSNAVEVAVYNSYVSDMGWYNDTIAKFSYLMSNFDIDNLNTGSTTKNDTTNFAITLGDEVGYVFKLGESKEWSITPQAEFTFGYFNQGDFKQTLQNSGAYLASTADAVLTLRSRVGSSFGYNFKRFTENKPIQASVYVGAFYEYDYISGGGITMSTDQISGVKNALSDLKSDGRVVMNVGTNMTIKDNTRLYFDFEKSFAGNITTDYQVNVGVRYSFGESNGYTPMVEKTEFKAPLKVEGETEKDSNETQDQESVENTNSKSKSETTTGQNTNSTENTTEEKAQ